MLQERGQQAQPNVEPAVSPSIRANRDVYAENVQLSQAPSLQEPLGNVTLGQAPGLESVSCRTGALFNGILTPGQAAEYLKVFQHDFEDHCFLGLPKLSLTSFRDQRPFLLLSMLCTATHQHTELHAALELELRKTLATRLIVNAERGLDLLQGLLIYLLWYALQVILSDRHAKQQDCRYHFHGDHASRMGILAHIALSLALELAENGQSDSESQRALLVAFLVSSRYRTNILLAYIRQYLISN
jgi:hypothetical protein